ncbi:MAG: SET domain-containing protein [bacterium]|nr:SET domain-containing protein [bacterium]
MNKKQFLESLKDVYCRLGCTHHGVGVVAVRDIPRGADPFKNCDPHGDLLEISQEELASYPCDESVKEIVRDFCALQKGKYYVPDYGIDAIDKSYFLNHSKTPNLEVLNEGEDFVAARDITAGEELTADYDLYNEEANQFER